jgi:hypothetical protein
LQTVACKAAEADLHEWDVSQARTRPQRGLCAPPPDPSCAVRAPGANRSESPPTQEGAPLRLRVMPPKRIVEVMASERLDALGLRFGAAQASLQEAGS